MKNSRLFRKLRSAATGLLIGAALFSTQATPAATPVAAQVLPTTPAAEGPQAPDPAATPDAPQTRRTTQAAAPATGGYRARSPEYGMNVFLWGNPATTDRDLKTLTASGFTWQKTLFQWRLIEPAKGQFDWTEADRVVAASKAANVKIIARLDFQPTWARTDGAHNGPPDNYQDFADFVAALVGRYSSSSAIGQVHAIEVWNEPNLDREWAMAPINQAQAADYVRLLKTAYEAAKKVDPSVTVISAGLSPTGTDNDHARPDDVYLQWMYDAGARPYFDVLGAHGPGYKAPPDISPDEAEENPAWGGHRSFTFRRVEDLRKIMVANGDASKQIWLLEFGWTTDELNPAYAWHRVTPEQQAEYLLGAYRWAANNWSPWIGVMVLWNLPDPGWASDREELWWSVTNLDGTERPALRRLSEARRSGELP